MGEFVHADATAGAPRPADAILTWSPVRPWRDVMVAGRWVIQGHRHQQTATIAQDFGQAMAELWA